MVKRTFLAVVAFAFLFGLAGQAMAAFKLNSFKVQYRKYEGGQIFNRVSFDLKDENGNFPAQDNLNSVTLYDPQGKVVALPTPKFYTEQELDAGYDAEHGIWNYTNSSYFSASYHADIKQDLIPGTYSLMVNFAGTSSQANYTFGGKVELPIIKAASIKTKFDTHGNLICEWPVSFEISHTNPGLQTSARAFIEVYKGSQFLGTVYIKVPYQMGRLFVPKAILNSLKQAGNSFKLYVRLQNYDGSIRTYSKGRNLSLKKVTLTDSADLDEPAPEPADFPWVEELDGPQN